MLSTAVATSMHSRFPVQFAKISGDATCSTEDACEVSLLMGELCMHAFMLALHCFEAR
jgi:hypothetical protein